MKIKEQIANFFTLMNLVCGFLAIWLIFNGNLLGGCLFVFAGAFFDFIDGFVARALGIASELGKQLDSLSDVVTFGVAPGFIAQNLLLCSYSICGDPNFGVGGYTYYPPLSALPDSKLMQFPDAISFSPPVALTIFLIPALIPAFSALRLAKFNIDPTQSKNFRGLPTPANGLLWASFGIILSGKTFSLLGGTEVNSLLVNILSESAFLIPAVIVMSLILVAPLNLMGMKFDKFAWQGNELKFSLIGISLILLIVLSFAAVPIILLLYIIFSIIHFYILKRT